jgi:3,4-dihydroxy 2-butanone 4-phosphate synthase / GTP cyclohydrolase II
VAADDFNRPGHVFPLRAVSGGVLRRPGHTEAAVDLTRLAGLRPGGVLAEIVNDDGTMARRPQLEAFARRHGLLMISIADLIAHRRHGARVRRESEARLPTRHGVFKACVYKAADSAHEHLAIAASSSKRRSPRSARPAAASCSTCAAMKAAASA